MRQGARILVRRSCCPSADPCSRASLEHALPPDCRCSAPYVVCGGMGGMGGMYGMGGGMPMGGMGGGMPMGGGMGGDMSSMSGMGGMGGAGTGCR